MALFTIFPHLLILHLWCWRRHSPNYWTDFNVRWLILFLLSASWAFYIESLKNFKFSITKLEEIHKKLMKKPKSALHSPNYWTDFNVRWLILFLLSATWFLYIKSLKNFCIMHYLQKMLNATVFWRGDSWKCLYGVVFGQILTF